MTSLRCTSTDWLYLLVYQAPHYTMDERAYKSTVPHLALEKSEFELRALQIYPKTLVTFVLAVEVIVDQIRNPIVVALALSLDNMTSLFARSLVRRTVERTLRTSVVPQLGALRFTSYYTPGEFHYFRVLWNTVLFFIRESDLRSLRCDIEQLTNTLRWKETLNSRNYWLCSICSWWHCLCRPSRHWRWLRKGWLFWKCRVCKGSFWCLRSRFWYRYWDQRGLIRWAWPC